MTTDKKSEQRPIRCNECGREMGVEEDHADYGSGANGYCLCLDCDARDEAQASADTEAL